MPAALVVRELRFGTPQRGYRTRVITLVTTLLDPQAYPATALAELYRPLEHRDGPSRLPLKEEVGLYLANRLSST